MTTNPEWMQLALYAGGAALLLILIFQIPYIGRIVRALFSFVLLAFCLFVLFQQAPFDPSLSHVSSRLGLNRQQVDGEEVRIRMAPDGHFWATARINSVERRMLIDSGATVTALSMRTADQAGVTRGASILPVVLQTANGAVQAETGTVERLEIGPLTAQNLKVVISPALGDMDVLGMNFLSQLASWRVEERTLILVPAPPA